MKFFIAVVGCCVSLVHGHAFLTEPRARLGLDRLGTNATKYGHSEYGTEGKFPLSSGVLETCGASDPGTDMPSVKNYTIGETIDFAWRLTLPHPSTGKRENVRLAIKYKDTDKFADNILYSSTSTDASYSTAVAADTVVTMRASPLTKLCDKCKLQWVWDSEVDTGGYIDCADITIVDVWAVVSGGDPCDDSVFEAIATCGEYDTVEAKKLFCSKVTSDAPCKKALDALQSICEGTVMSTWKTMTDACKPTNAPAPTNTNVKAPTEVASSAYARNVGTVTNVMVGVMVLVGGALFI